LTEIDRSFLKKWSFIPLKPRQVLAVRSYLINMGDFETGPVNPHDPVNDMEGRLDMLAA